MPTSRHRNEARRLPSEVLGHEVALRVAHSGSCRVLVIEHDLEPHWHIMAPAERQQGGLHVLVGQLTGDVTVTGREPDVAPAGEGDGA